MKKFWVIGAAAVVAVAIAAVAYAQGQTNTYTVDASTSPTRAGSAKKPVPIAIDFDYAVGEVNGNRPSAIKKYSIRFAGTRVNPGAAASCSNSTIQQEGADGCPAGSKVGSGYIENATGQTANPADQSVPCNAKVTVINVGNFRANIYVEGNPNATDPRERCAIQLAAGIPARFVRRGNTTALEFEVPESLLHPGSPALTNAVKRVQSKIRRITRRIRGKRRGYFESRGGCVRGTRLVTVVFTPESGPTATAQDRAPCRG